MLNKCCMIVIATAGLLACVSTAAAGPKRAETTVTIKNLTFTPGTVSVKVGDTVTWQNADDRDHTVTGEGFKSGNIKPGKSFSYTFTKAGNYTYGCSYHPRMRATITVSE